MIYIKERKDVVKQKVGTINEGVVMLGVKG